MGKAQAPPRSATPQGASLKLEAVSCLSFIEVKLVIDIPFETERLRIRRFESKDLDAFLEFMLDEDSTKYLMFEDAQKTEQGARELFQLVSNSYESPDIVHSYAIADKTTDEYLGSCGYSPYAEGIVEIYYSVNRGHWRKGIASEAVRDLAKRLSNYGEVRAYCDPKNQAAHAVAKNAGLESEGIQQHEHFGLDGELFVFKQGG
jgi:RimJ/RimL family protein N-acetyltransferase